MTNLVLAHAYEFFFGVCQGKQSTTDPDVVAGKGQRVRLRHIHNVELVRHVLARRRIRQPLAERVQEQEELRDAE